MSHEKLILEALDYLVRQETITYQLDSHNYKNGEEIHLKLMEALNPKEDVPYSESLEEGCGTFLQGTTSCGDFYIKTGKKEFCDDCKKKFAKKDNGEENEL